VRTSAAAVIAVDETRMIESSAIHPPVCLGSFDRRGGCAGSMTSATNLGISHTGHADRSLCSDGRRMKSARWDFHWAARSVVECPRVFGLAGMSTIFALGN
jgi:hypothetical protein